jgi:hypothetical protein
MTIHFVTAVRLDVDDFSNLSDVFTAERLNFTPLIVFIATEDAIQVRLLDHARDLLSFPDETSVMGQWRGTMIVIGKAEIERPRYSSMRKVFPLRSS